MDRPILLLMHVDESNVVLTVEYPDGDYVMPIIVDRDILIDELIFRSEHEIGNTWIRIPARVMPRC